MAKNTRHPDIEALDELSTDDWKEIALYAKRSWNDKYSTEPIRCQIHGFLQWLKDREKYLIKGEDIDPKLH